MARIRTIKPEFFRHEGLYELEQQTGLPIRVAFAGLWTACDREGRFKWTPRNLKLDALPFDDVDFSRVLDALATRGHIVKYTQNGREFGFIPSWNSHQVVNNREAASELPDPQECSIESTTSTREPRVDDACGTPLVHALVERKGKEGKGREGDSADKSSLVADAPATKKPRPSRKCPESFAVTDELIEWARDNVRMTAQALKDETDKFRDHTFKNSISDWPASWRNWMRNAEKFGGNSQRSQAMQTGETAYDRIQREKWEKVCPAIAAKPPAGFRKPTVGFLFDSEVIDATTANATPRVG